MKIGIISDPHCCDGSEADNFIRGKTQFFERLAELRRACDLICVAGDIFALRQSAGERFTERMGNIVRMHPRVVNELKGPAYRKLRGNHDAELRGPRVFDFKQSNCWLRVTHGHEFDLWNSRFKWIENLATVIAGKLERAGWVRAETVLGAFADRITGTDPRAEKSRYWIGMKNDVLRMRTKEDRNYSGRIIRIIGHTHDLLDKNYGNDLLIQSGKCCHGSIDSVTVDMDRATAVLESRKYG